MDIVDVKQPTFEANSANEFKLLDLREAGEFAIAVQGVVRVCNAAADMGGIMRISKFVYSSSACVYPMYKRSDSHVAS